jgi:hypothetical protein
MDDNDAGCPRGCTAAVGKPLRGDMAQEKPPATMKPQAKISKDKRPSRHKSWAHQDLSKVSQIVQSHLAASAIAEAGAQEVSPASVVANKAGVAVVVGELAMTLAEKAMEDMSFASKVARSSAGIPPSRSVSGTH